MEFPNCNREVSNNEGSESNTVRERTAEEAAGAEGKKERAREDGVPSGEQNELAAAV